MINGTIVLKARAVGNKGLRFLRISFKGREAEILNMIKKSIKKGLPKLKDTGVRAKSSGLAKKRIAVAVCGGIASVEVIKIIRELRRHGAEVRAFYSPEVKKFITELPVAWASQAPVCTDADAEVLYLENFDLVLVAPATLNTISKATLALTDNVVTLLIACQLGKKGALLFVPTMNSDLQNHPLYGEYRWKLESWGAKFLESLEVEDRIKMPSPEEVAEVVVKMFKGRVK